MSVLSKWVGLPPWYSTKWSPALSLPWLPPLFSIGILVWSQQTRRDRQNQHDGDERFGGEGYRTGAGNQHHHRHRPLKKLAPPTVSPLPFNEASDNIGLELVCEIDEQWSYVGKKSQQRWLWYAWWPHLKRVFAYALGSRGDDTLKTLLDRIKGFNVRLFCTDDWGAYDRLLPEDKHLITKQFTQSIERQNLNFRTRIKRLQRKTICFSKSVEIHDKVIGEFINRAFFQLF